MGNNKDISVFQKSWMEEKNKKTDMMKGRKDQSFLKRELNLTSSAGLSLDYP